MGRVGSRFDLEITAGNGPVSVPGLQVCGARIGPTQDSNRVRFVDGNLVCGADVNSPNRVCFVDAGDLWH